MMRPALSSHLCWGRKCPSLTREVFPMKWRYPTVIIVEPLSAPRGRDLTCRRVNDTLRMTDIMGSSSPNSHRRKQ